MMRGWQTLLGARAVKAFAAVFILAALTAVPLPQATGLWQGHVEASPPSQTPPGQLKRRGLVGTVVSLSTYASSTPATVDTDIAMTVETRWVEVDVIVPAGTPIHGPLQGNLDLADTVGFKVAILLDKPPLTDDATSANAIRTVTAKKIMVVPGKAARTHARAAVKARVKDRLQLVSDDGQEIEVADDGQLEEGEDVILVAQRDNSSKGERARLIARGLRKSIHISERLVRITDRLIEEVDSPRLEKLKLRILDFQEKQEKRLTRIEERLSESRRDRPASSSVEDRPREDNAASLDSERPTNKQRRENLTNLLDRIETAVVTRVREDRPQQEERPRDRVTRVKAEVKERAKERLIETRDRFRNTDEVNDRSADENTDAQNGRRRASNVLDRIIGSTGDEDVVEAKDAVDGNEGDSTPNPRLRERVTDEIKREIRDRVDDGSADENEGDATPNPRLRERVTDEIKREIRDRVNDGSADENEGDATPNPRLRERVTDEIKREVRDRVNDANECRPEENQTADGCEVDEDRQIRPREVIQRVQEIRQDRRDGSNR